ncbi:MAG: carboxypeptidase-like regulatory domain-containing protein, partial [Segetibacter sp.]
MKLTACRNLFGLKKKDVAKIWITIKFAAIFMFAICLHANAKGFSQKLTISHRNVSLQTVFKDISEQTGYTFIYTEKLLQKGKKISIVINNASIEQVLKECFKGQALTYSIVDKYIIVKEKEEGSENQKVFNSPPPPPPPTNITGKVTNDKGEPLGGATITEKGTKNTVVTMEDGSFSINTSDPKAVLVISYVGYEAKELPVLNKTTFGISLVRTATNLNDVVVVGYGSLQKKDLTGSVATIDNKLIRSLP